MRRPEKRLWGKSSCLAPAQPHTAFPRSSPVVRRGEAGRRDKVRKGGEVWWSHMADQGKAETAATASSAAG